ncbi:ABC transporter permease [Pseudoflavonifractor phocaeensis]|uniref:ABC transporter permease n=1 Tax=Pseudoflavonifractor phocaeensis TaxID=1870988 RepID=UPI00195AEE3F|nr:ABC transporter permease [Pseudoflavonifractor phocaeensis]MBM6869825.1 ABC transporter permease [Pseudoflavonifractor phocaeensis]MBM6938068.1 ABC transporter permease [Pseudoflavonifractor phocaeensis]
MAKYVIKRVIMALITILVVACVTFLLMMSVPGSPFNDEKITAQQMAQMDAKYGLDKPLLVQMANYMKGALHGDLGVSLKMQKDRPVLEIIAEKFPLSAKIGVIALIWAVVVGVPLGCLAAYNRGKWIDSLLRIISTLGISMPGFVVATFLLILFCNEDAPFSFLGIKTIFDESQGVRAYFMPCFALGLYPMCYIARLSRSSMLDALGQDYIKTARAKGLATPKIIFKHALRNGVIPVITYLGPLTAFTLCGGFVVETVFTIPGLGRYFVQSVQNRDYFLIMGTTIFLATLVIVMNLVVDILYKVVDPRIDLAKGD